MILRAFPWLIGAVLLTACFPEVQADGPADNRSDAVRRIPPPGIAIPDDLRRELTEGVTRLGGEIESLRATATNAPVRLALLPDIQIFHKAVDWALRYDEFFRTNEVEAARAQLQEGFKRAAALRDGKPYWTEARGLVVRGYVSRIDGSIQPYGLVVPEAFDPHDGRHYRLDVWFHGRGEQLSELAFLNDRMRNPGEFTPRGALVLHPYGRYCNGSRFAGETDFWEALADVRRRYPVDEDRIVVRGFSLGGASCWHIATHFAGQWAAAAPGAGFSETAEFLRVFQNETLRPAPWEQKLWQLYDATAVPLNVSMVPLVAYSGADDKQIQAAQAMERAMAAEGLTLTHLIGPKTGHRYEPETKAELSRRIDTLAAQGRNPLPLEVRFETVTLRYPTMAWVTVDALTEHWDRARIDARMHPASNRITVEVSKADALTFRLPPGRSPFDPTQPVWITVNGVTVETPGPQSDRSWEASIHRDAGRWVAGRPTASGLRKVHGLQGPVDDAFMDAFLFVRPTGTPLHPTVGQWVSQELNRAVEQWRRHYRGDVPIKDDTAVTDEDIATRHLILWGDPQSNALLARVGSQLGVRWDSLGVHTPSADYPPERFVAALIYPNPQNPSRYVVVNSGFTFREYDYLNNARQTPKLPDWAILDLNQPSTPRAPGGIAAAGFFDEQWRWKP